MSTPKLGRKTQFYKDGVVIGYGKNISIKASAGLLRCGELTFEENRSPAMVFTPKEGK